MLRMKITVCIFCLSLIACESTFSQKNASLTKSGIDSILNSQISGSYKLDTINFLFRDLQYSKSIFGIIHFKTHKGLERRTILLCNGKIYTERTIVDEWKRNLTKRMTTRYSFINGSFVRFSLEEYRINKKDSTDLLLNEVIYYFNSNELIDQKLNIRDDFKIKKLKIDSILKHAQDLERAEFVIEPSS